MARLAADAHRPQHSTIRRAAHDAAPALRTIALAVLAALALAAAWGCGTRVHARANDTATNASARDTLASGAAGGACGDSGCALVRASRLASAPSRH